MADEDHQPAAAPAGAAASSLKKPRPDRWQTVLLEKVQPDGDLNDPTKIEYGYEDNVNRGPDSCNKITILDRSILEEIKGKHPNQSDNIAQIKSSLAKDGWEYEKEKRGDTGKDTVDVFTRKVSTSCHLLLLCSFYLCVRVPAFLCTCTTAALCPSSTAYATCPHVYTHT